MLSEKPYLTKKEMKKKENKIMVIMGSLAGVGKACALAH
jgi:hypothetical protein